ncbi:MAG TPA: ATPase [Thermoplasmata archaeon]|nr:ATPase [Thermoplasmata archaeon]
MANKNVIEKVGSGIYGLDTLLDGGLNKNSVTLVVGSAGTGKTTCAIQFLMKGLREGVEGIHITLDEPKEQVLKEAKSLGFDDVEKYVDSEQLIFMEAAGKDFYDFIKEELPELIAEWEGTSNARIVIDPLTPVIWSMKEKYHQREVLSTLFYQTKKIGTLLCTLEEHGTTGGLSGPEVFVPMYLADGIIHLSYIGLGFSISKVLKVIKMRGSWHSSISHPYQIVPGMGIVVAPSGKDDKNVHGVKKDEFGKLNDIINELPPEEQKKIIIRARKVAKSDLGPLKFQDVIQYLLEEFDVKKRF